MRKTLKRNLSYDDRNHLYYVSLYCDGEDGSRVHYVVKDGKLAAVNQKLVFNREKHSDKHCVFENSVHLREFSAKDFEVPDRLKNVAVGLVDGQLLTEKVSLRGEEEGLNLLATAERHGKNGNLSVCLLKGYGIRAFQEKLPRTFRSYSSAYSRS